MSKSPLLKASSFVLKNEETIVIDSNERMAAKIEEIANSLENMEQDFSDSFSEGIEASQVAALLSDEEESNVIHKEQEQTYDGPSPQELVDDALKQIEEMKRNAQDEIESTKAAMMQEAVEEGHKQGYTQGYEEGLQRAAMENEAKVKELDERENLLREEYQNKLEEIEPTLIHTLTEIYSHIFDVEMSGYHNVILHLIDQTLHRIDGCQNYLIRVSREDFPYVSMQKQEVLYKCVTESAKLEVVEDITLSQNECLIETESGIYDCSVGTELQELKKQLLLLCYQ